jgi:hypothetical protein
MNTHFDDVVDIKKVVSNTLNCDNNNNDNINCLDKAKNDIDNNNNSNNYNNTKKIVVDIDLPESFNSTSNV